MKFGAVPEEVLFDNARALVVEHDATTHTVVFNDKLTALPSTGASATGLRAISSPHQGQDREWLRLRQAERGRRAHLPELGGF